MFWVGVSLLVMSMTGLGDDTRFFIAFLAKLKDAAREEIREPARREAIEREVEALGKAFFKHRAELALVGDCIARADDSYGATAADYQACAESEARLMEGAAEQLISARTRLHGLVSVEEAARVRVRVVGR
jgi:hypothetical protein